MILDRVFEDFLGQGLLAKYTKLGYEALINGDVAVEIFENEKLELINELESSDCNNAFLVQGDFFVFQKYWMYQRKIADFVGCKIENSQQNFGARKQFLIRNKNKLDFLFSNFTIDDSLSRLENIDWQKIAVISAFLQDFCIITGGPGTGKTTTVAKLLEILLDRIPSLKIAISAPTGKAAARLKESLENSVKTQNLNPKILEIEALTLHRLLGYVPNKNSFKHNAQNPLSFDVLIVDEASMIDLPLMAKFFDAIKSESKVILLGDKNQLPPVDIGDVFGDLCRFFGSDNSFQSIDFESFIFDNWFESLLSGGRKLDALIQLQRSYRFSSVLGLGKFAKSILDENEILFAEWNELFDNQGVVCFEKWNDSLDAVILENFMDYIKESDPYLALKKFNQLKILCATKDGAEGVVSNNLYVENLLEKHRLIDKNTLFYLNRPVMITSNDYNLGLFNGDVGVVKLDKSGECKVFFEDGKGGVIAFNPSLLNHCETVFAMTIHKSQGSEFETVILPVSAKKDSENLNKQLLYTAITRAKNKVYLIGSELVVNQSIQRRVRRVSLIRNLLEGDGKG
jgi:exodeoxyribonuclease V alpha subunit